MSNHARLWRHGLHLLTGPLTDAAFASRRLISTSDGRVITRANATEASDLATAMDVLRASRRPREASIRILMQTSSAGMVLEAATRAEDMAASRSYEARRARECWA